MSAHIPSTSGQREKRRVHNICHPAPMLSRPCQAVLTRPHTSGGNQGPVPDSSAVIGPRQRGCGSLFISGNQAVPATLDRPGLAHSCVVPLQFKRNNSCSLDRKKV